MIDRLQVEQQIVAHYMRMASLSQRMLAAAVDDDWDRVCATEQECARVIDALSSIGDLSPTDPALRRQKLDLMKRVLADDAAIRLLSQPWLKKLDAMLQTTDVRERLGRAYGAGSSQG